MKRMNGIIFCLLVITSCASAPSNSAPASPKKRELTDLTANDIKIAISRQHQTVIEAMTERSRVAVLDIASSDHELGVFATEEIIMFLVKSKKFRVVDRDSIETILKEQNFQYSGVVNDATAVSIGKFIGASVIITGVIRQRHEQIDFSLKMLDVETAEIIDLISIPIWEQAQ